MEKMLYLCSDKWVKIDREILLYNLKRAILEVRMPYCRKIEVNVTNYA